VLRITKSALKPIFESNPELVRSISEIIEERKELLKPKAEETNGSPEDEEKGMLRAIKNFFGLR